MASTVCGICGIIQIRGEPRPVIASELLDHMTDAMTHRGPDDRGTMRADGVALGVRRLSIVDVQDGHQPFASEDGEIWAIQNGELYNHDELRRDLRADGHRFRTRCDTEVIPHLYERFGASFEEHLRGKFGIAVWDGKRRCAVLARDRLGIKPLYYAEVGDLLVFASELKSLLASGLVGVDLDYEAIEAFLTLGYVPGPSTPLAAVKKLPPGHRLVVEGGRVRIERFWSFPEQAVADRRLSVDEYAEGLIEVLDESVRLRLMGDVPLGAMLSGGIDSSLVVALMARQMSEPVKTFAVGFAEAGEGNELGAARFVADTFGTDHHEIELSFADQTVALDELVWHLDEPLADLSALGLFALSELAAKHVTVALCGQGADELLGGYPRHRNVALAASWNRLPTPLRQAGPALAARGPARFRRAAKILAAADPATRFLGQADAFDAPLRAALARGPLAELDGCAAARAVAAHVGAGSGDLLSNALALDSKLGLVDDLLQYFDRTSMAHSLEVRVPFLDHRVVEYCATIPSSLKVRRLQTKHVLKHASRGLLPDQVIDRPKVGFFHAAMAGWFRAQTRGAISDFLLSPSARYPEMLDRGTVERLVSEHAEGAHTNHADVLLRILMLEVWLTSFLPRALAGPVGSPVLVGQRS